MRNEDGWHPAGSTTLRSVDAGTRPVVERLSRLERHDLSRCTGDLPGPSGLFEFLRPARFFTDADHHACLIHADGQLAGFCLTRPFDGEASFIHAFFVVRALRRRGVGLAAATDLLRSRRDVGPSRSRGTTHRRRGSGAR